MYLNEEVNVYFSSYALQSFLQLHSFSCTSCVQSMYYVVNKHDRQIIQSMGDKKIRFI